VTVTTAGDAALDEGPTPADVAPKLADWDALAAAVSGCTACADLAASRTRVVVGVNPPGADVLFIGEAPGAQEDAKGVPFVGRSGQLLDKLLDKAGLPRERVAVCNVLKCRPPDNRKPKKAESDRCAPWLRQQIALVDPVLVCALGSTSAEWALGRGTRLGVSRRQVHRPESLGGRPLVVTYHPSAALRGGPDTEVWRLLGEDLAWVAELAQELRAERDR
jgi:uracil-DNA glycosylase family 4